MDWKPGLLENAEKGTTVTDLTEQTPQKRCFDSASKHPNALITRSERSSFLEKDFIFSCTWVQVANSEMTPVHRWKTTSAPGT